MQRTILITLIVLATAAVGGTIYLGAQPGPQPAFGQFVATPSNFVFKTPVTVTFTIKIDTPTLNPTTVELYRVDQNGSVLSVVGRMYDNGQNSDSVGGDKVFTSKVSFNEQTI